MGDADLQRRLEKRSIPVPECGCWIWVGANNIRRYGCLKVDGVVLKAHRASWIAFNGPIPDSLHVLHKCDVPECINPDHLFLGTHFDNMRDKERKGRANHATGLRNGQHTHPHRTCRGDAHYTRRIPGLKRGEGNGRAKLNKDAVLEIRASNLSQGKLARMYGVTKPTIRNIKRGKLWSHI